MGILDKLGQIIQAFLIEMIGGNLTGLLDGFNTEMGKIAGQVGTTPQEWNGAVFDLIKALSDNVILPIAGIIITYVFVYELISMVTEKNNLHDVDTWMFFKYFFKMLIAAYLVANVFTIVMAIFDMAQFIVKETSNVVGIETSIDIAAAIELMKESLKEKGIPELVGLCITTFSFGAIIFIMKLIVTIVVWGRMIEIYLYTSVAPIPFATLANKEWGSVGSNYIRGLLALAFQGFFIILCVAIYGILIKTLVVTNNIEESLFQIAIYTGLLCLSVLKTGALSKSIFNAH